MKIKKMMYLVLGCIGLGIGAVGAVLPLLPAFPFLLLAAFCFAKSSERLHTWFVHTRLYKNNLESYIQGRGMTWNTKIRIMITVTVLMSVGFIMMSRVPVGRIILACVWAFHIIYFIFGVKTLKESEEPLAGSGVECGER
ncbi:MAG: YbaN family protein [Lachnospiraceae bacterium]|nr:YbaN family protein [Lachnospiraceae bacterium]